MNTQDKKDKPPYLNSEIPTFGLISIGSGLLAILVIVVAYKIFLLAWTGPESPIFAILFLFLPGTALGLALAGIFFGKEGIKEKDNNRVLGVIGILISLLPLLFCCLLIVFFLIWSGLLGVNFSTVLTKTLR